MFLMENPKQKMDDDWGYPYFFVNLHGDLFEIAERNTD